MFGITKQDVSALRDDDLRELVALLCDAELSQQGIPNAGVTRGGNQDAADGGIDVRVSINSRLRKDGYIPRKDTGFQVKKPNMRRADIIGEMCPKGVLRPAIVDLAQASGAYVIISSGADLTDSTLREDRILAMKKALGDVELSVDFYDQERIRTWTNNYPSLVYWVKSKLGKPIKGWKAFGNWTGSVNIESDQYFIDEGLVIKQLGATRNRSIGSDNDLYGVEALEHIRKVLAKPQKTVRLVGLSGVGKTRFAQALFDPVIGAYTLPSSMALYTDAGDEQIPSPQDLLNQLVLLGKRVAMVVDNCGKELHHTLTRSLSGEVNKVSLLTIEYDVRENLPAHTDAFQLEPGSPTLVANVVKLNFPHLNFTAARRVTLLAGGNYRVALLLAEQIQKDENVSEITDAILFKRIFRQGNEVNSKLLQAAEALSIVYSFDFSKHEADSEIGKIGQLVGIAPGEMHRYVVELERRGIVQARSKWRAVLPHALANRLARHCIENTPPKLIEALIFGPSDFRLLKSVSRRLNYLKGHDAARNITKDWCTPGNFLARPFSLDRDRIEILKNISPIHESTVLQVLEEAILTITPAAYNSYRYRHDLTRIIVYLTYEQSLFSRALELLIKCYSFEQNRNDQSRLRDTLAGFFQARLSGTNASLVQRIDLLREIWLRDPLDKSGVARECLNAGLKVEYFHGHPVFEYDYARNDYGYQPSTQEEITAWFHAFIRLALELYKEQAIETSIQVLANRFRGLWKLASLRPYLVATVEEILTKGSWIYGWVAIHRTLQFDREEMDLEASQQLEKLFLRLQPQGLVDQIRVYVLMEAGRVFEKINGKGKGRSYNMEEANRIAEDLGARIGNDLNLLAPLIGRLLHCQVPNSLYAFGRGVGKSCTLERTAQLWQIIRDTLASSRETLSNTLFVQGYIAGTYAIAPSFVEQILDDILEDFAVVQFLPALQRAAGYNKKGIQRLLKSLDNDHLPVRAYSELAYENNTITNNDLIALLQKAIGKEHGIFVCIDVLNFRAQKNDVYASENRELLEFVFSVVKEYDFFAPEPEWYHDGPLYDLKFLVESCFDTPLAHEATIVLLENFKSYFRQHDRKLRYLETIIAALMKYQPIAVLDALVDVEMKPDSYWEDYGQIYNFGLMISSIPNDQLLQWCSEGSVRRYERLAKYVNPIDNSLARINDDKWVELVIELSARGRKGEVLAAVSSSLSSAFGRRLSIFNVAGYRTLLDHLAQKAPDLQEWIEKERVELHKLIEVMTKSDTDWERYDSPQSFE